jgi:hypothetical protein
VNSNAADLGVDVSRIRRPQFIEACTSERVERFSDEGLGSGGIDLCACEPLDP